MHCLQYTLWILILWRPIMPSNDSNALALNIPQYAQTFLMLSLYHNGFLPMTMCDAPNCSLVQLQLLMASTLSRPQFPYNHLMLLWRLEDILMLCWTQTPLRFICCTVAGNPHVTSVLNGSYPCPKYYKPAIYAICCTFLPSKSKPSQITHPYIPHTLSIH